MFEVEIKSLLGGKEKADELRKKLTDSGFVNAKLTSIHGQRNHYFEGGNIQKLYELVEPLLEGRAKEKLRLIVDKGKDISVRTREAKGKALLVLKASVDDTTSANGISRAEFEEEIKGKGLDELDTLVLNAGFRYQAKWSREREEYGVGEGITVTIDKNAGYGYLAEFEKVVSEEGLVNEAQNELRELMNEFGAIELPQERLERMFAYYNEHWPEYYGTDKIFTIE
ncbi:MAG: hypothetical protein Q8P99_02195 [bacterium]|nr:hypothetical protein [bacterium]MDZ4231204.1 hypothetical protein [Patescibacteria group bacterium]